jgi:2-amino-4-hydroxy-6-hydroxymethyldihydropteridine diphosphokinase
MAPPPCLAVVGLGASLADRRARIELAVRLLALQPELELLACSRIYRTPPWGGVARNPFLNAAVLLRTRAAPETLLALCKALEARLGRRSGLRWGDRALDLDLLWMGEHLVAREDFVLPHPRIAERAFVVLPMEDVLPGGRDPVSGQRFLDRHRALGVAASLPRPVPVGILPRPRRVETDS